VEEKEMTTQEHLQSIRAKCVELISVWEHAGVQVSATVSGWRATIAAIDAVPVTCRGANASLTSRESLLIDTILAAWPEELL
jgi:hypothetical protein